jgi:uncharacterized protein
MIPRSAEKILKQLAQEYPVVTITGPRQSGKTTLVRSFFKKKTYVSLENPDLRDLAQNDPRSFLDRYKYGAIFDEVQKTPHILSYLQEIVDKDSRPGRFILTGSQQFDLLSGITQSLAGRTALIQLLPFSYKECYSNKKVASQKSLDQVLYTGLYPPIHDRQLTPSLWYANYVQTYIERDVRQLINIRDLEIFRRFVRLCAGRVGQLLNLSDLASDCGITHNTAKAWISILEASYIIFLLRPHHRNFNKRLIKTPKIYFYDTGVAAWLLSIQNEEQLNLHMHRGSLFECFFISEILKTRYNNGLPSNLFFWRDRSGNEVDLLIDNGISLQPIEIKSGSTLNRDFFKSLKKWNKIAGQMASHPILIYGGEETTSQDGIQVFSWKSDELYGI